MAWWHRLFPLRARRFPGGGEYIVPFRLYSKDGKRGIEVRVRRNGLAYFVDQERVEGTIFKNRGQGQETGPYETPEAAEAAAVARPWFSGGENSN
jgi:hypothetical protein